MTDQDIPTSGEQAPSVPALSLGSESMSFAGQLYVPKLSAKQAIVWLAVAIVPIAFSWAMWTIGTPDIKHLPHGTVVVAASWWTVYFPIVLFASCFVTSCVLTRAQCFRMLGQLQPGHWIVLLLTFECILGRIAQPFTAIGFFDHSSHVWARNTSQALLCFTVLAAVALWAFAAVRLRDATRWRVLLALRLGQCTVRGRSVHAALREGDERYPAGLHLGSAMLVSDARRDRLRRRRPRLAPPRKPRLAPLAGRVALDARELRYVCTGHGKRVARGGALRTRRRGSYCLWIAGLSRFINWW